MPKRSGAGGRKKPGNPMSGDCPVAVQLVGETGFEPATSCSRSRRATKLRYSPISNVLYVAAAGTATMGIAMDIDVVCALLAMVGVLGDSACRAGTALR
jgi:hypothetical protein